MSDLIIGAITLLCVVSVVVHHIGYPLLLRLMPGRSGQTSSAVEAEPKVLPSVSLIVPIYNESRFIVDKLWNLAALDYPSDCIRFELVLDGCTDDTAQKIYTTLSDPYFDATAFHLVEHTDNQGKVARLNQAIGAVRDQIVLVSDVSALISIDAIKRTVKCFEDPQVGVITGTYQLVGQQSESEQAYWRYQSSIKRQESRFGALMGAHGAFFALRRSLFKPLSLDTINDDFLLAIQAQDQGYKGVYLDCVNALELEQATSDEDNRRRVRLAAGNWQQSLRTFASWSRYSMQLRWLFLVGKGLRPMMPWMMLLAWLGSAWLAPSYRLFALSFGLQTLGYAFAALTLCFPNHLKHSLLQTLAYLVKGHVLSGVGALQYLKNPRRYARWTPVNSTEKSL